MQSYNVITLLCLPYLLEYWFSHTAAMEWEMMIVSLGSFWLTSPVWSVDQRCPEEEMGRPG